MIFYLALIVGLGAGCFLGPKELGFELDDPTRGNS